MRLQQVQAACRSGSIERLNPAGVFAIPDLVSQAVTSTAVPEVVAAVES